METVVVLLMTMMTVGLSHGVLQTRHCDARQNGAQCFAPPGGTVELRLVETFETGHDYYFKFNNSKIQNLQIFKVFKKKFKLDPLYGNRSYLFKSNGTFGLRDVTQSDEAHYVLEIWSKDGAPIENKHLHLFVQVPVSSPKLSSKCLSQGQTRLSCSCDHGDSVQYNWTLDGQPLTGNHLFPGERHDTQNTTLTQEFSGLVTCDVSNGVSRDAATKNITACTGFKFINCTSNGTRISEWVFVNDTSCPVLTTTTTTTTTTTQPPSSSSTGESSSLVTDMNATSSFSSSSSASTHIILTSSNQATALASSPAPSHPMAAWFFKYLPHIAGSLAALLLLLLVGVGIYCSQKKKKSTVTKRDSAGQDVTYADVRILQKQNTAAAAAGGDDDDDVTYAAVTAFQKKNKKNVKTAEGEVEYGQVMKVMKKTADTVEYGEVKVSGARPSQDSAVRAREDACIYDQVRVKQ